MVIYLRIRLTIGLFYDKSEIDAWTSHIGNNFINSPSWLSVFVLLIIYLYMLGERIFTHDYKINEIIK